MHSRFVFTADNDCTLQIVRNPSMIDGIRFEINNLPEESGEALTLSKEQAIQIMHVLNVLTEQMP